MDVIKVGEIINTFGIKGELKIKSCTDFPEERFKKDQVLYINYHNEFIGVSVLRYREHKGFILLSFKDLLDINLVEKYKGCDLLIEKQYIKSLNEGYYFFELKGCEVYANDICIGKVAEVESGYQSILRINDGKKEVLVPYVDAFIKNVDVKSKRIDINTIEGLL